MSDDKMLNNLKEISEIVVSNPIGGELSLEKVTDDKLETKKKYKEVFVSNLSLMTGNVSQTALQVANQGITIAQIAKQAPNGLFTATVNPVNLSKFANGTTSTMVRDASGHLVEHAGFANVGLSASVNPAILLSAGMQVMSAVSGTYYLHKINTQITDMDAKLEELLKFHHDTNIGRLIAARKGLSEIANREFVDTTDLTAIRNYKKAVDEIHEEYVYRLKRFERELISISKSKPQEEKHEDINFTVTIAFEANKLSLFAELIEIGTRMKIGGPIEIVNELRRQLKMNYSNSFYHNVKSEVKKIYSIIKQQGIKELDEKNEKNKENKKLIDEISDSISSEEWGILAEWGIKGIFASKNLFDIKKVKGKIHLGNEKFNTLTNYMEQNKENDGIDNIIAEVIELEFKETELLYILNENDKQRVFVPYDNE